MKDIHLVYREIYNHLKMEFLWFSSYIYIDIVQPSPYAAGDRNEKGILNFLLKNATR